MPFWTTSACIFVASRTQNLLLSKLSNLSMKISLSALVAGVSKEDVGDATLLELVDLEAAVDVDALPDAEVAVDSGCFDIHLSNLVCNLFHEHLSWLFG